MEQILQDLKLRRALCDKFIHILMEMDDPRREDALAHYREQLTDLDTRIIDLEKEERKRLGLPEPEPVVVGLKTAQLFGKAQS